MAVSTVFGRRLSASLCMLSQDQPRHRLLFVPELTGYCWGSEAYCGEVKKRNLGNETFFSYSPHWTQLLHPSSRGSIEWCLWFCAPYGTEAHTFQGWDRPKHHLIWLPGSDPHPRIKRTMEVHVYKRYFFITLKVPQVPSLWRKTSLLFSFYNLMVVQEWEFIN